MTAIVASSRAAAAPLTPNPAASVLVRDVSPLLAATEPDKQALDEVLGRYERQPSRPSRRSTASGSNNAVRRPKRAFRRIRDLYAAAERLIAEGVTAADQLAVAGASNGGLLVGAAVTQRPELWRAVVCLVPLTDLLRFTRDGYTMQCTEEYGDPTLPADARTLLAYSPVHNVRPADYPVTLIVCAGEDIRCSPWHRRKLAAALAHETTGRHQILLRVWSGAPHMAAVLGDADQTAEWLGFVCAEIGLEP